MAKNSIKLDLKLNVKTIQKGIDNFIDNIDKMNRMLSQTFDESKKVSDSVSSLQNIDLGKALKSKEAQREIQNLTTALKKFKTTQQRISKGKYPVSKSGIAGEVTKIKNAAAQLKKLDMFGEGKVNVVGFTKDIKKATGGMFALTEAGKQVQGTFKKIDPRVEILSEKLKELANKGFSKVNTNMDEFTTLTGMSAAGATAIGLSLVALNAGLKAVGKYFSNVIKQTQQFGRQLLRINDALRNTVSGIRLATQGFLSIARAMTFFVAVPITAFLKEGVQGALELEQALIRVQKVTGDMFADMEDLTRFRNEILELSTVTASSAGELANYAEQLGQMGVRSEGAMMELVAIMDVVAQATDISADQIAQDLGSIANAFGMSMSEGSEEVINFVDSMAETINALENNVGATATDIVATMKDMGSAFSGLTAGIDQETNEIKRMTFASIAALGAAAREMGMSADEAGTALKNLPGYLVDNADVIDELNIKTEKFATTQQFVNGLNTDFEGTLLSLVGHLSENASTLETVSASVDLLGRRTGRLLSNLVKMAEDSDDLEGSLGRLDQIIEIANTAWEEGGSLMSEYDKMLGSTTINLKRMQHSLEQLGATVGDDVLPIINKFIGYATAGFLALTDIFGTLDNATKNLVGRVVGLAAAFGPVSWFLSQISFGLSMIINGFMRVGAVIVPVLGALKMLIGGLITLNPILIAIGGLLYSIVSQYTDQINKVRKLVDDVMKSMAKDSLSWGEAVMGAFSEGIQNSARIVIGSVQAITDAVAMYLEAHSPTKLGALSNIDMWGEPLMNTWLAGFADADYDMLSDVAKRVEGILTAIHFTPSAEDDDSERKKVLKDLISFREQFSKLLKDYRSGVDISQEYIDNVLEGMGDSSDELSKLINLSLEYERIQRRLSEIEQERNKVSQTYKDRVEAIRLSGSSAEDMVESIASAQYARDRHNEALDEEETRLERREELLEKQIETQEAFLDALQEQSDLWQELLKLQTSGGSGGSSELESMGGALQAASGTLGEFDSKLRELRERFIELKVQAQKIKGIFFIAIEAVKGLWNVIFKGADPEKEFEDLFERAMAAADPEAHGADLASEYWGSFGEIDPEKEIVPEIIRNIKDFGPSLIDSMSENLNEDQMRAAFSTWLGDSFDLSSTEESEVMDSFEDTINNVIDTSISNTLNSREAQFISPEDLIDMEDQFETSPFETFLGDAINPLIEAGEELQKIFGGGGLVYTFNSFFQSLAQGWVGMEKPELGPEEGKSTMVTMQQIAWSIGNVAETLAEHVPGLLDNLGRLATNLTVFMAAVLNLNVEEGETNIETFTNAVEAISEASDKLRDINPDNFRIAGKVLRFLWKGAQGPGVPLGNRIRKDVIEGWNELKDWWQTDFRPVLDDIKNWWKTKLNPWFDEAIADIGELVSGIYDEIAGASLWQSGWDAISSFFKGLDDAWQNLISPFINKLGNFLNQSSLSFGGFSELLKLDKLFDGQSQGGGPAIAGQTLKVGEGGAEAFSVPYRGHITSASLTNKMMNDVGGYGGESIQINVDSPVIRDEQNIDQLVDTIIYKLGERA